MSYRRDLKKLGVYLKDKPLSEVTAQDLQAYVESMDDQGFKPATVSRNIASIKAFYHYLVKEGVVSEEINNLAEKEQKEREAAQDQKSE